MSIDAMLSRLEDEGRLVRYLPPDGIEPRRGLYLSRRLYSELADPRSAFHFFGQLPAVRILFNRWTGGQCIVARMGGGRSDADLALLKPPPYYVWEFRIRQHAPQLRIFARFAAPDLLIATNAVNRDALGGATARSGKSAKSWLEAMYDCTSEWNGIFGRADVFRGGQLADYISENYIGSE